jgi:hypothetical protein
MPLCWGWGNEVHCHCMYACGVVVVMDGLSHQLACPQNSDQSMQSAATGVARAEYTASYLEFSLRSDPGAPTTHTPMQPAHQSAHTASVHYAAAECPARCRRPHPPQCGIHCDSDCKHTYQCKQHNSQHLLLLLLAGTRLATSS